MRDRLYGQTDRQTQCKNIYIYIYIFTFCPSVRLSVRLSVRVVDHALTAEPIDFIFGMHIDVIPRSDIGILDF